MASVKQNSLPSFAQTFNMPPTALSSRAKSPNREYNSLPPIQRNHSHDPNESIRESAPSRKRPRYEPALSSSDPAGVKEEDDEQDIDMLEPSPPPLQPDADPAGHHYTLSTGSNRRKRRLTASGNRPAHFPPTGQPVSPASQPSDLHRKDPHILLEQRRGSVPGIMTLPDHASTSQSSSRAHSHSQQATIMRASPNLTLRREAVGAPLSPMSASTSRMVVPSQPEHLNGKAMVASQHSRLPTANSFGHRRSAKQPGGKRKPANILISPRDEVTQEQFAPTIQSAPPIPRSRGDGKAHMALPRIPQISGPAPTSDHTFRSQGKVPLTPTRFKPLTSAATPAATIVPSVPPTGTSASIASISRSPPNASIPISSIRVPATPSSLNRPANASGKSAFLAPFEMFYDAVEDSRQLKAWLYDQLTKSNALIKQQEQMSDLVDALVEKKVGGMRREIAGLQRKVDELEGVIRSNNVAEGGRRSSFDAGYPPPRAREKLPPRSPYPTPSDTYAFPPPIHRGRQEHAPPTASSSRLSPPTIHPSTSGHWPAPHPESSRLSRVEAMDSRHSASPASFEPRTLSISAARLESGPPPPHPSGPVTASGRDNHTTGKRAGIDPVESDKRVSASPPVDQSVEDARG